MANFFTEGNKRLLETGEYHDFIIVCGDREFKVHRAIICPKSNFFRTLCSSAFKESVEGRASFNETEPSIFERVLTFLYTKDYKDKYSGQSTSNHHAHDQSLDEESTVINVKVYILADLLGINSLAEKALEKFVGRIAVKFPPPGFEEASEIAFKNTPRQDINLRRKIVDLCLENEEETIRNRILSDLLNTYEPLAWSMLRDRKVYDTDPRERNRPEGYFYPIDREECRSCGSVGDFCLVSGDPTSQAPTVICGFCGQPYTEMEELCSDML